MGQWTNGLTVCRTYSWTTARTTTRTPTLPKLTKEFVGWPTTITYPSGGWHKGAATTVLLEFVEHLFKTEGHGWSEMYRLAGEAAIAANDFLRSVYSFGAFMSRARAQVTCA